MDTTKGILFLFFLFHFLFVKYSFAQLCYESSCRIGEPTIRFPFQLQKLQPMSCGYPGFNLSCDASNQTVVRLPNSGQFTVQGIDYQMQRVWLNDPDSCLPRRLLTLDLSGSPFSGYFYENFVFFNCTEFDYTRYKLNPIGCLSGRNYTVFASSSVRASSFLASRCRVISTVAVPVQTTFSEPVATSDLSEDILLSWGTPQCGRCESRGGRCGLKSNSSTEIECSVSRRGLPRGARYAIIAGAGVPAFLFLVGFVCCLCGKVKRFTMRRLPVVDSAAVAPQALTVTRGGLDSSTIESYPKTILGESGRLPEPDQSICSICLSEFEPKETLRSIPECQHCFHADCVDQWLRLKASCPVCRNSPNSKCTSVDIQAS